MPRCPSCPAMIAAASSARLTGAGDPALTGGCVLVEPDDDPDVAAGALIAPAPAGITGSPFPGVRLVVQASEAMANANETLKEKRAVRFRFDSFALMIVLRISTHRSGFQQAVCRPSC